MEDKIKIIGTGKSEVVIKKSRFLGVAMYVETEEEVQEILAATRKEHYSARHVCYAYSIGEENPRLKFSDDGEPGGTAGKPILDVINGSGIYNILVVVTRYFGGVLLGTGGLVRAYSEAAKSAVENADKKTVCLSNIFKISLEYGDFDKVRYILEENTGISYETDYSDKVVITATVPEAISEAVKMAVTEKTAARADIEFLSQEIV